MRLRIAGITCALAVPTARTSLKLARLALSALPLPPDGAHRGVCVVCGAPVIDGDPFLRYRGEYYHAHNCVESSPPAQRMGVISGGRSRVR